MTDNENSKGQGNEHVLAKILTEHEELAKMQSIKDVVNLLMISKTINQSMPQPIKNSLTHDYQMLLAEHIKLEARVITYHAQQLKSIAKIIKEKITGKYAVNDF